jgi:hypothetical protein
MPDSLRTWTGGETKAAVVDFVERVAVFDNDGTLWCEKPMPIELGFILARLAEMAEADESLRGKQPWKAARERDHEWLGGAITKHYHGDEKALEQAQTGGWTIVSVNDDWETVFASAS